MTDTVMRKRPKMPDRVWLLDCAHEIPCDGAGVRVGPEKCEYCDAEAREYVATEALPAAT